ncbi:RNA polymerase sigma factor [Nocardioides salsibiostraticola]
MDALETTCRDEWGRLLALLVAQYRRLDLAEDALGDAFEAAARRWPVDGVPDNQPAWLLTAARRRAVDRLRRESVATDKFPLLVVEAGLQERSARVVLPAGDQGGVEVIDERLRLVLLCAHPTLAPESAAALTLRLVMGVPTADIARLFLVSPATMSARLTRARKRLVGQDFTIPVGPALLTRVGAVADIAYLAFTAGYAPGTGQDVLRVDQAGEAIRLVRVIREVVPPQATVGPDLDALLALMLLQHSRREARVGSDGGLVLLSDQDRRRWYAGEIDEAVALLSPWVHAPGTAYLLQALIAAEHALARDAASTDWPRICERYAELEALTASPVVRLNHAVARAEADGPETGLRMLEGLSLPGHRLPAARAELLLRSGAVEAAKVSFREAIDLCANAAESDHLARRMTCC